MPHATVCSKRIFQSLITVAFLATLGNMFSVSPGLAASSTVQVNPKYDELPVGQQLEVTSRSIEAYQALLHKVQTATKPQALEPLLNQGQLAATSLLGIAETLDESTFKTLSEKLEGYLAIRDEVLVVSPKPDAFLALAKSHGQPVDVLFFALMGQTLNGYWPTSMEQLTDLSGCTRFGSGDLVRLYGSWSAFERRYPNAYRQALADPNLLLLSDIKDQLLHSVSACGSRESVEKELDQFVRTYPKADITPEAKERLEAVRKGTADIAYEQGAQAAEP